MRIIIVEDEPVIREGLVAVIEKFTKHEVVCRTKDGIEGMRQIKKLHPDLVIADIRMPNMSGLEMIERLRNDGGEFAVILLTGYSDFEYARKAVQLNVTEYLLKPLEVESLIAALGKAENSLEKTKANKVTYEQLVWSILNSEKEKRGIFVNQLSNMLHVNHRVENSLFMIQAASIDLETNSEIRNTLNMLMDSFCIQNYYVIPLIKNSDILVMILYTENNHHMKSIFENIILKELNKQTPCICSFDTIQGLENFSEKIDGLREMLTYSLLMDLGKVIDKTSVGKLQLKDIDYPEILEKNMRREIRNGNWEKIEKLGYKFEETVINVNMNPKLIKEYTSRFTNMIYESVNAWTDDEQMIYHFLSENIMTCKTRESLSYQLWKMIAYLKKLDDKNETTENALILRVINYVRNHYNEEITLTDMADMIEITPEYLSRLFNQEMKINFNSFVKNFRISMAKRLLMNTNYQISEVAEKTGFHDSKYFNKVFKSVCGLTPSEYKKEMKI